MLLALKWIHREIINFNGDAQRITIMGHSSGAMTTSLMSMLPAYNTLFHQVIALSGTSSLLSVMPGVGDAESMQFAVDMSEECYAELVGKAFRLYERS